eukprot:SAG22_NODE_1353_length_4639_cov_4.851101_5_plen_115_part_00
MLEQVHRRLGLGGLPQPLQLRRLLPRPVDAGLTDRQTAKGTALDKILVTAARGKTVPYCTHLVQPVHKVLREVLQAELKQVSVLSLSGRGQWGPPQGKAEKRNPTHKERLPVQP